MQLYTIDTGFFKLDGGAMFGVVPKVLWSRTNPADENNLCPWAMRSLLIEDGERLILIDNGIGDKQDDKFLRHYYLHGDVNLHSSLDRHGFSADDITDVFLTHLHFDHCGCGVIKTRDNSFETTFKNAKYWSNKDHWAWATEPNQREGASFLKENFSPILDSGQLNYVEKILDSPFSSSPLGFEVLFVDGHTEKQMIPIITCAGVKIAFAADLVPTHGLIPVPYIMSYDVRPLTTLKEKAWFLNYACENNIYLFFEHDPNVELASLVHTDRGVRLDKKLTLKHVL